MEKQKTERLHALDSLRAIMMLLGIVLHSALTYMIFKADNAWSIKDPNSTHLLMDYFVFIIHNFRMQTFFFVAGFFGAMLFYERSPKSMIKNRFNRIVLPLLVFTLLVVPIIQFAFSYAESVFSDSIDALSETLADFETLTSWLPTYFSHLWFLYYLVYLTLIAVFLAILVRKIPKATFYISIIFSWVIQKPILRVIIFASLTYLIFLFMGSADVPVSNSYKPNINTLIYFLFFYLSGWLLFKSKHLLDCLKQLDRACVLVGVVIFSIAVAMLDSLSFQMNILVRSIIVWLFIFGITGLFLRYASHYSARMRYIADASYWIYLIHLPLTIFIPVLIVDWQLHAILKFVFVVTLTSLICFATYHYFVRSTFIGQFLNGKKYSRREDQK